MRTARFLFLFTFCHIRQNVRVFGKSHPEATKFGVVLASAARGRRRQVSSASLCSWKDLRIRSAFLKTTPTLPLLLQVNNTATGILGETFVPTVDSDGNPIMSGMDAIRGTQDDCEFLRTCLPQRPAWRAQTTQMHRKRYLTVFDVFKHEQWVFGNLRSRFLWPIIPSQV